MVAPPIPRYAPQTMSKVVTSDWSDYLAMFECGERKSGSLKMESAIEEKSAQAVRIGEDMGLLLAEEA